MKADNHDRQGGIRFDFEFKSFRMSLDKNGSRVCIEEILRNGRRFSVNIDLGGVDWLIRAVLDANIQRKEKIYASKYQASYALFLVQRYQNKNGSFLSLMQFQKWVISRIVVIPAGRSGEGWTGFAKALRTVFFKHNPKQEKKERMNCGKKTAVYQKRVTKELSYAEAVINGRNNHLARLSEDYRINRRENDHQKQHSHAVLTQFQSTMGFNDTSGVKMKMKGNQNPLRNSVERAKQNDWQKAVICTRESIWIDWGKVKKAMNKLFEKTLKVEPFQPDKAILWCKDEAEARYVASKGNVFVDNSFSVNLQCGEQLNLGWSRKLACTGGWIEIYDLPLKWWRKDVFKAIGTECGGLMEVCERTLTMEQMFCAKIKIGGKETGFIPAEIDLSIEDEATTIKLKVLSKINFRRRFRKMAPPYIGNFDRCSVNLYVGENGEIGFTPFSSIGGRQRARAIDGIEENLIELAAGKRIEKAGKTERALVVDTHSELIVGNVNRGNYEVQLRNGFQIGNLVKLKDNQVGPSIQSCISLVQWFQFLRQDLVHYGQILDRWRRSHTTSMHAGLMISNSTGDVRWIAEIKGRNNALQLQVYKRKEKVGKFKIKEQKFFKKGIIERIDNNPDSSLNKKKTSGGSVLCAEDEEKANCGDIGEEEGYNYDFWERKRKAEVEILNTNWEEVEIEKGDDEILEDQMVNVEDQMPNYVTDSDDEIVQETDFEESSKEDVFMDISSLFKDPNEAMCKEDHTGNSGQCLEQVEIGSASSLILKNQFGQNDREQSMATTQLQVTSGIEEDIRKDELMKREKGNEVSLFLEKLKVQIVPISPLVDEKSNDRNKVQKKQRNSLKRKGKRELLNLETSINYEGRKKEEAGKGSSKFLI